MKYFLTGLLFFVVTISSITFAFDRGVQRDFKSYLKANDVEGLQRLIDSNKGIVNSEIFVGSPLMKAAGGRAAKLETVKLLVEYGAEINYKWYADNDIGSIKAGDLISTPLYEAITGMHHWYLHPNMLTMETGHQRIMKVYQKSGQSALQIRLKFGDLTKATKEQRMEIIKYLIDKGADVNVELSRGPLLYSTLLWPTNMPEVVKLLIESGANPNATVATTGKSILESLKKEAKDTEKNAHLLERIQLLQKYIK